MLRNTELGAVRLKTILMILLLGAAGYVCAKVFPPYFANSQLKDKMFEEARFAQAHDRTPEQVRDIVYREAQRLEIPLERQAIVVEMDSRGTRIGADYSVIVDLHIHQLHWDFHTTSVR
jgi:hypothetical protein